MFSLAKKQKIDNYIIAFPIKEGDYAETYRVKDAAGKNRFLKLIDCAKLHRTQFDSNGNILEVDIAKQLNHPNIVKLLDCGDVIYNGRKFAYIVFDFFSGESASQFLARVQDCNVYVAKTIVIGILNGLKYIHSLREPIIHNNITLQNTMLDVSSGITITKITDFSHARYLSQNSTAFNKNGLSPFFVAPEALNGVFSVKSDIFSVGAVLFNLIYGIPPYFVDLADCKDDVNLRRERIDAQREQPLQFPNVEKFELDENLMNIMRKALAYDIEDRFQTADEFIRALNGEIQVGNPDLTRKMRAGGDEKKHTATRHKPAEGEGFAAIAGMQELKNLVKTEVIDAINQREEYERYGVSIPNGMLLYGPPGCGKTFFAKQLAAEVGFNFMVKKPSDLQSKWVNATQENIAAMFREAEENAPTIIFLDEMNELTPNRDSGNVHQMHLSAVNELLANMDRLGEKGIFVIGATNYPHLMDPAILRSGRLDKKFYVAPPDFEARKAMFEMLLKKRPYDFGLDYDRLAKLTENNVFSDLALIINDASRQALLAKSRITMAILEKTIAGTKPSLKPKDIEKYDKIRASMEGDDTEKPRPRIGF